MKKTTNANIEKKYNTSVYATGLSDVFIAHCENRIHIAADKYLAAVTIKHPATKETIIAKGELLTESILDQIHAAGIRYITVLDQAGKRRFFNADVTGEVYKTIFARLFPSCERKAIANTMAAFSKSEDGEYSKPAMYRYYDPELLCDHIAYSVYMDAFPFFAATKVSPSAIDKVVNAFISNYGYKAAISSMYGSRHRFAENSLYSPDNEEDDALSVLDKVPSCEGAGADERLMHYAQMSDLYDCAVHRFITPCVAGNNSLAKGLVALFAKVVMCTVTSPSHAYLLTAKVLHRASSFEDLVTLYKRFVKKSGCTLSSDSCRLLDEALRKTPTAKAFPGAGFFAGVAWADIPIKAVFDESHLDVATLQVFTSDHLKAVRRFEMKNIELKTKFIY